LLTPVPVDAAGDRLNVEPLRVLPVHPVANAAQQRKFAQVLCLAESTGDISGRATEH